MSEIGGVPSLIVSVFALTVSIVTAIATLRYTHRNLEYTSRSVEATYQSLLLNTFDKALEQLGTEEARDYRRLIFDQLRDCASEDCTSGEGEEVELWVRCGESIVPKSIRVRKLRKNLRIAFEETAVRVDRIGFIFSMLGYSTELKVKYLKWLCVMLCANWNRLAPYIFLKRKERARYDAKDPSPIYFVPYFEKIVYEAYDYYRKIVGESAKIFCLNPTGVVNM